MFVVDARGATGILFLESFCETSYYPPYIRFSITLVFRTKLDIICNTCIDSSFMYSPTSVIRNLDYPNAVPNVESAKKMVFPLKSQTLRLSRVHVFVCHTYMFNVGTQWYVIVYSVKCKGLQTRPCTHFYVIIVCVQPEKSRYDLAYQNSL